MYLGSWYEKEKQDQKNDACFERALKIEPSNPYARRAVAIGCIIKGDLDRAGELLSYIEQPGSHQEPMALCYLADAYYKKAQYGDALRVYEVICRLFPSIAKRDKSFRRSVIETEKALGRPFSILPKASFNRSLAVGIAFVVLIGVVAFFVVTSK